MRFDTVTRPENNALSFYPTLPTFILEVAEEGGFIATDPKYPGAVGQGETEEEAIRDLEEAIKAIEEELRENP